MDGYDGISLETKLFNLLKSDKDLWSAVGILSSGLDINSAKSYLDALQTRYLENFPQIANGESESFKRALESATSIVYLQQKELIFL